MTERLNVISESDQDAHKKVRAGLVAAFRRLMRPLVRMLIRNGIAFGEFAEALKSVYVQVASEDFALPGRKTSASRVAILTGLTRKEVKRLSDLLLDRSGDATKLAGGINRSARVLSGWHQDPEFTGPYGIPLDLPFDGPKATFTELVRRYSGDMPARAMLEELKRVGAVEELENGELKTLSRYYITAQMAPADAQYIGDVMHDLASTIEYNFSPDRSGPARFERWVATENADPKKLLEFHQLVKEDGQHFLEKLDTWLSVTGTQQRNTKDQEQVPVRIRVGVYFYQDTSNGEPEK